MHQPGEFVSLYCISKEIAYYNDVTDAGFTIKNNEGSFTHFP